MKTDFSVLIDFKAWEIWILFFFPAFSQQPHGSSLMKGQALDLIQIITKSKQNFKIKTNSEESVHLFGCRENEGKVEK